MKAYHGSKELKEKYGIPICLARLEDTIFEGLPNNKAKSWPIRFMSSFKEGKDYSRVVWDFLRWLLLDYLFPKITQEGKIFDDVRKSLKDCADVLGKEDAARVDARADAYVAAHAAADRAAAFFAAEDAAYAAAEDAAYAAAAAAGACEVRAVAAAAYAYTADAYILFSEKLIEIIEAVK